MDQRYIFATIVIVSIIAGICILGYLGINGELTHALIGIIGLVLGILTGVNVQLKK